MRIQFLLVLLCFISPSLQLCAQDTDAQAALDKTHQIIKPESDSLASLYKLYSAKISAASDTLIRQGLQTKLNELDMAMDANKERELRLEFDFVGTHLSSPLSLDILYFKLHRSEGAKYYETFSSLFRKLIPELQKSEKGREMQEALANFKNSQIGSIAPAFSVRDINGKQLTLKSLQNKSYVLLDFWASWCVPCRQDLPFLKQAYQKYRSKGFEIISISTDTDADKWKEAIKKESIEMWKHFSTKENKSNVASIYFVAALPVKILIDKEGSIVARWRGGGEENQTDLEKTLHRIFE